MRSFLIFSLIFSFYTSENFSQSNYYSIDHKHLISIQQAVDSIYSLNFTGADSIIQILKEELPDYPGINLLEVYYLIWKHKPMTYHHAAFQQFHNEAYAIITKSHKMLDENSENYEALFYVLSTHAILTRLYVDSGMNWKAIKEAQKAYKFIKKGMHAADQFPELNLYCGIYNYYRVRYPEDNPYARPFLWFFMKGDKETGEKMLLKGAEEGVFTKVECLNYLYYIKFRYDFEPDISLQYISRLYDSFPMNETFTALYVENKIYLEELQGIDSLVTRLVNSDYEYYQMVGNTYLGILLEREKRDENEILQVYNKALEIGAQFEVLTPHYESLCYLGIGRVYMRQDKITVAKSSLKKAANISEYGFVRDEAKYLLKHQK